MRRSLLVALAAAACAIAASQAAVSAEVQGPSAYRQAVADAYSIVSQATPGDRDAAQQAIAILRSGTGQTQPEILASLAKTPPDFKDAGARLAALLRALDNPATTTDPAAAQKLHDVLSLQRYDALHRPPTPLERLSQWVQDRVRGFLQFLFGRNGGGGLIPDWLLYAAGAAILAAVAYVVFRSTRGRLGGEFDSAAPGAPRPPEDYFDEGDRLAAGGDRVGAVRALCAAVAATLAGEGTWDGSPLTVREIFGRASDPAALRALLLPFEAAVYGGRDVDAATYEKARAAAAPFRAPAREVAA